MGNPGAFSVDNLVQYADEAKLNADAFRSCLESDEFADAYLKDHQYAGSVGLTGTPSFLVNGNLVYSNDLIPTVENLLKRNLR